MKRGLLSMMAATALLLSSTPVFAVPQAVEQQQPVVGQSYGQTQPAAQNMNSQQQQAVTSYGTYGDPNAQVQNQSMGQTIAQTTSQEQAEMLQGGATATTGSLATPETESTMTESTENSQETSHKVNSTNGDSDATNISVKKAMFKRSKNGKIQSYVQPFQNSTVTLSGLNVRSTMYFTRVDYWKIKKATFTLNFEVSQLANNQISDITMSINGVKFYSFRPNDKKGRQTIQVTIPADLIQDSNVLTIDGQIMDKAKDGHYLNVQTPANWLTIYDGSNVNFEFDIIPPTNQIRSFYNHFIGVDTLGNNHSAILTPQNPTPEELEAATYALAGMSRLITTDNTILPMNAFNNSDYNKRPYQVIIALYKNLPEKYRKQITKNDVNNRACLRYFNSKNRHVLVVTAETNELLVRAGRYVANQELMQETAKVTKYIYSGTSTFSSTLQFNGNYPLTSKNSKLVGPNHQEQVFFVQIPTDQTNAEGSYVNLNFRYSDNLNFDTSLMTIYVNNKPIGSKALTRKNANGDHVRFKIPTDTKLANSFVIKVAFDLNMKDDNDINMQTPWAYIENNSNAYIKTRSSSNVLFNNYPSILIEERSFNNIGVQLPEKMNSAYFDTISNIFNLIGNYAESNVGEINFYSKKMTKDQITNHNVIVIGTPDDNPLIREYNNQFYFQYNDDFDTFKSNEKLSIESSYGRTIGIDQLLFNPYDNQRTMLVVTGVTPEMVQLASTQINTEANMAMYKGDAIVIDSDGQRYDYRFKERASYKDKLSIIEQIKDDPNLKWYLAIGIASFTLFIVLMIFFIRKYQIRH